MSEAAASQPAQPSSSSTAPTVLNKHAPTPLEQQRLQLERLLKDPSKPVHIPKPPVEKTLRTPREMMKNVQGSSAGAGSGEFHVYKQSRRREYERLKIMDEKSTKESEQAEFERRKRERDEAADAKTAKNRAKRQKRKAARKKGSGKNGSDSNSDRGEDEGEIKKKRILGGDGKGIVFRWPGEEDDGNVGEDDDIGPSLPEHTSVSKADAAEEDPTIAVVDTPAIFIHDDD